MIIRREGGWEGGCGKEVTEIEGDAILSTDDRSAKLTGLMQNTQASDDGVSDLDITRNRCLKVDSAYRQVGRPSNRKDVGPEF